MFYEPGKSLLNGSFVLHVQTGGGLVQQNDGRILQEGAGNGNALALAAGKGAAIFADVRVPLVRQLFGKFLAVCQLCRRKGLLVGGTFAPQTDILQDRIVKQSHILKHDGIQAHELFRVDSGNLHAAHGDAALLVVPEPCCQSGNGGLAAAGGSHQCRDLPLLCGKGDIPQHRFAGVVGKAHMVEHDIAALIGQLLAAGLQGSVQNLVHPPHIGAHGNDRRQILQRALHRVIHPGSRHQEQKQGQHIDTALHQQHRAGECHRCNAQLEHHARRGHKQRCFQFCCDGLLFHSPNFAGKTGQITLLRIAGFQVPESLDVLLNAVRTGHFRRHGLGLHLVLHPVAAHHDGNGYRDDPQCCQSHPSVKGEQAQSNEHRGDEGTE